MCALMIRTIIALSALSTISACVAESDSAGALDSEQSLQEPGGPGGDEPDLPPPSGPIDPPPRQLMLRGASERVVSIDFRCADRRLAQNYEVFRQTEGGEFVKI